MKTKFLTMALLASAATVPMLYQDAVAAYVDPVTGYSYSWIYDPDGDGVGSPMNSQYIDQFQIYVRPGDLGVHYYATQKTQVLGDSDALTLIGLYHNDLLSVHLDENSANLSNSSGVNFVYHPDGINLLPLQLSAQFGAEDSSGNPANGLNIVDEFADLTFNYWGTTDKQKFLDDVMFASNHFIYVHLQGLDKAISGNGEDSQKWLLTWEKKTTPICIPNPDEGIICEELPEPNGLALLGIGLLGMGFFGLGGSRLARVRK